MMEPFAYQKRVFDALRDRKRVIVQAPTGSGKTRAGLYPFLRSRLEPEVIDLPVQCIYSVPLQALARQFYREYGAIVTSFRQKYQLRSLRHVAMQTGADPGDPRFEADILFTTIDQTLSSFLSIPYGLSRSLANFNVGAVLGAYHIFDEYHLFPVNKDGTGALMTTMHMLHMLKEITPWTLMTATFSRTLLRGLCELLDAEEISPQTVSFADIPSQRGKRRSFSVRPEQLTAGCVWEDMREHNRQRVLVICNTVERAMQAATELRGVVGKEVQVLLLYNRFFQEDRVGIERTLAREFGEDTARYSSDRIILVATQVVEVGLNITAEVLHTELAPASSIIQRAGRCARFAGQSGQVFIYDVPRNAKGAPDYAPYYDQIDVCLKSWDVFTARSGDMFDYDSELDVVEMAHKAFDQQFLNRFDAYRPEQLRLIKDAWTQCSRAMAPKLIRDIDNVTLLIHPNPTQETVPNPYSHQGISIRRSTLRKYWQQMQDIGANLEWILAIPREVSGTKEEQERVQQASGQSGRIRYSWEYRLKSGSTIADIEGVDIVVVNPAVVCYDKDYGLRIQGGGDPSFTSPVDKAREKPQRSGPHVYRYETYEHHISMILHTYQRDLRSQGIYAQHHLESRLSLTKGTLDLALRLIFAIHDVGKLDEGWQRWAHAWQHAVHQLNPHAILPSMDAAIAHTDVDLRESAQ